MPVPIRPKSPPKKAPQHVIPPVSVASRKYKLGSVGDTGSTSPINAAGTRLTARLASSARDMSQESEKRRLPCMTLSYRRHFCRAGRINPAFVDFLNCDADIVGNELATRRTQGVAGLTKVGPLGRRLSFWRASGPPAELIRNSHPRTIACKPGPTAAGEI